MNRRIRVLIVDDSSVVRKLLTSALAAHPEIEIVGTAANGILALSQVAQVEPDAMILDIEMPEMDGITTLRKLRQTHPHMPVVMFSTLTERGASATLDAMDAGASDYVLKPSTQRGESLDGVVAQSLVPKLIALSRALVAPSPARNVAEPGHPELRPGVPRTLGGAMSPTFQKPSSGSTASKLPLRPSLSASQVTFPASSSGTLTVPAGLRKGSSPTPSALNKFAAPATHPPLVASPQARLRKPVQIIAIASSTGGPNALADVLPRIPKALSVPVVVVQHMPPIFTRCLAERLDTRCAVKVLESEGGELLTPGTVYIAPGNRHLEVRRDADGVRTVLTDEAPENSCRPAADVLFRSVVRAYGGAVLGVVLTGMGQDGARGAREIHDVGGRVLVQSGPTCVVWGMPKAVEEAGLAEAVVPLPEMAAAILQRVGLGLLPVRTPEESR